MTDAFLVDAQREVDALLPDTPRIAPAPSRMEVVAAFLQQRAMARGFTLEESAMTWRHPDGRTVSVEKAYCYGPTAFKEKP